MNEWERAYRASLDRENARINPRRLGGEMVIGVVLAKLAFWLIPGPWDYVTVGAVALAGIVIEVSRARRATRT